MSISVKPPLLRQNFGVVFYPTKGLTKPVSNIFHFNLTVDINLDYQNSTCGQYNHTSKVEDKLSLINDQINILIDLIMDKYIFKRTRRALLLLGGKILKALFGVLNEEDMEVLKKHLDIVDNIIHDEKHYMVSRDKLITRLAHSQHEMSNHIKVHIAESIHLFNRHEHMIKAELYSLNQTKVVLQDLIIQNNCLWKIRKSEEFLNYILGLLYSLDKLQKGYICDRLIPVHKMHKTLQFWDLSMRATRSRHLAEKTANFYFSSQIAHLVSASSRRLTIGVRVPLSLIHI